jgi:hypothetical protein
MVNKAQSNQVHETNNKRIYSIPARMQLPIIYLEVYIGTHEG